MREQSVYGLLRLIKFVSRVFYRFDISWLDPVPQDPWENLRLVVFLNHTSLYEPLFVGWFPDHFLKRIACHGVMPVADKALRRPVMGYFFRMVAHRVIAVTRRRDESWKQLFEHLTPDAMVVIMPEGRMKRAGGLDNEGRPMTVRGGIADIIDAVPGGRMLITLSAGLHHVQVPGQLIPRCFKTLRMRLQNLDIARYRQEIIEKWGREHFKHGVIHDLEHRRDTLCR